MITPASLSRSDSDSAAPTILAGLDLTVARKRSRRRLPSRRAAPPAPPPAAASPPYARSSPFATQDADAETAVMMEEKETTPNPGALPDATVMEGVEGPPAVPNAQAADQAPSDAPEPPPAPTAEGASDDLPAISTQSEGEVAKEESSNGAQTQAPDEKQVSQPDTTKSDDAPLPAETTANNQPTEQAEPPQPSGEATQTNDNIVPNVASLPDPFVSGPQGLNSAAGPGVLLMDGSNGQEYLGSMDVQPSDAMAIPPDMLAPTYLSSNAGLQVEDSRQCAFAKLEFPDGDFYMTTYAVELGRDTRAFRQEMRRRNQEELQEQQVTGNGGEGPQTPMRPTAPSVASVCRSNLSECGGIMGGDDYHVNVAPLKRKRRKKEAKSTSSSSQRHSRKSSIAGSNAFEPVDYNGLVYQSQPESSSFLPDPYEVPLVPIHPPTSDSGPVGHKGISRKHLKIFYSFDNQVFEMKVLGRNGAFLNEVHYMPENDAVELHDGDKIQIGAVTMMFRLPNAPADDEDVRSESSDSISGGISLNFEDGRGQSIIPDDESDDDGFSYAEQYDFSPHAYGWDSEEEEFSADDDAEDEYREHEQLPKVKLKLKLKQPAQQAPAKQSKAEARLKKKKKKEKQKLKAKQEAKAKAAGKTAPKAQGADTADDLGKDKAKEKEKEKEKEKKEKKDKVASKTASKTASKAPSKTVAQSKEKSESTSQVNIVPPEDVPQPSTEIPQPEIKTEGAKDKEEKKPEAQPNKDNSGRRVLTAEEAEKLGLEPGTVIERKKGPGRPPKDGIMSKREKAEIMRRKKEAEKARKLGLDPESITKVDLTRPREKKDGEGKADKKPKEGTEGESAGPDGEGQGTEKKSVKISRPLRTPSPEMKESDYTEEQLQRPAANYVVLIHEAISNSKEGKLNLQQIYSAIERKYPYYKFKTGTTGWQSSVRHNLGQHDAFRKAEKEGKGWLWAINPGVSIEKERRKRVTPPPQAPPRPYYPPSHQSPYGMPHGAPGYQHPPGPYPPRPPAAPGQPYPAAQQRTYQSPYGSQPLGQAAQPVQHRPPYGPPNGARPPYPSPYGASPYGAPPSAPAMSYPPSSSAAIPPGSSYATASPSPYATSGAPAYSPPAHAPAYPPRPPHSTQSQHSQPGTSQPSQHHGQHNTTPTPVSASHPPNEPIPPRKPNLYSDTAPYAPMLNNFRDYYIRNAHAMLKRKLTRDEIVKLTDRGLERALFPERYPPKKEEDMDESAKLDLKDEKDIEDAVKGMLKKFNYGYLIEEAERRIGRSPMAGPASAGHPQTNGSTSTPVQSTASIQVPSGQTPGGQSAQGLSGVSGPITSTPAQSQAPLQTQQVTQPPVSSQEQTGGPGSATASNVTSEQNPNCQPPTDTTKLLIGQSSQDASQTDSNNGAQSQSTAATIPVTTAPVASSNAQQAQISAPSQVLPPRANGTSTPVPPPVEALTPLGGSPKPGTPVNATPPAPGSGQVAGKQPPPAQTTVPATGIKRSLDSDGTGEHEGEAKKPKVEGLP